MHDPEPNLIAEAATPMIAKLAAAGVVLTGVLIALTGVQTMLAVTIRGALAASPWALLVIGSAMTYFGAMVYRARFWGAVAATGASAVGFIAAALWAFFSFSHGLYSLFALAALPLSIAAVAAAALSIVPCQRASAARAKLASQGLDLGL